ncbi:hypothetical protein GCM10009857_20660 [Agromyces soli]
MDVVVPVHRLDRPIDRAVASALREAETSRVIVVGHELSAERVRARLGETAGDPRVEVIAHHDGVPSPAGPVNAGLERATADFVIRLDSDDEFEPGLLASLLAAQRAGGASVAIPLIRRNGATPLLSPLARAGDRALLDPIADRLVYRTHTFALVDRRRFPSLRLSVGLATGEDVEYAIALWFSGRGVAFARSGPAYRLNDDAGERVTTTRRPVADDLACVLRLLDSPTFSRLPRRAQRAVATKLLRNHVLQTARNRPTPAEWSAADRVAVARTVAAIRTAAPSAAAPLSIAERRILRALADPDAELAAVLAFARRPRRLHELLLTADPSRLLARDAPLRMHRAARALSSAAARG